MLNTIKITIKELAVNLWENKNIRRDRKHEIRKFEDPRRIEIYEKVQLTQKQKTEIDTFFAENYGEKIPYTWHRHYTAFTGRFDSQYFPEMIYTAEFERFMTMQKEYARVFSDKNILPLLADSVGVKMPKTLLSRTMKVFRDADNRFISRRQALQLMGELGEVFIKPSTDSSSGQGCFIADFHAGTDRISGKSAEEILTSLSENFLIQNRIACHASIARIYPGSVNTFRIITYRWQDGIVVLPAIMRIGQGGNYLDNAHAGGMFVAIDADGTLHKEAFTEFNSRFTEHPDTHLVFEGYKIELFPKAAAAAVKLHEALPQIGCVNWDLTIDAAGESVLIEANINDGKVSGGIWVLEMAHGCGPFGENTAEILRWIRQMKQLPYQERYRYQFGYFKES